MRKMRDVFWWIGKYFSVNTKTEEFKDTVFRVLQDFKLLKCIISLKINFLITIFFLGALSEEKMVKWSKIVHSRYNYRRQTKWTKDFFPSLGKWTFKVYNVQYTKGIHELLNLRQNDLCPMFMMEEFWSWVNWNIPNITIAISYIPSNRSRGAGSQSKKWISF